MGWFIMGLILGAGITVLAQWVLARQLGVKWYEWVIGALSLLLILLIIQNFIASQAENEPTAAWMGLLFMGVPAVILGILAIRLPWQRQIRHTV
jgi:drug/metabolite transporter (DMT)-like permease